MEDEAGEPAGGRQAPAGGQATQQTQGGGDARGEGERGRDEFEPPSPPEGALAALWRGFSGFAGPFAKLGIQLSGAGGLGRTAMEEIAARTGIGFGRQAVLIGMHSAPREKWEEWKRLTREHAGQILAEAAATGAGIALGTIESGVEWGLILETLDPAIGKALEKVGLVAREKRVYAPEKVEVITAQQGDAGAVAWKLGKPTKDITEKWVMGSPAPRTISPEASYYKVPVGLKEHGAALKVGELPFSLHPSALKLGGGGTEAVATLTREGGAAVLKGLPVEPFPYAGKQTLSVIFPWEGAAGGAGSGGAALARLPPPSGGAAAAVPTGGGGLLSLEKLSAALGGATGGVPSATLATVTRATPLPIFLPVPPSPAQAQRQEAGTETVARAGEETVVRRGDETLPRRSEDTVPRITGEETVVRKPEDTVPVPERKTGGATGGSTAVIPAEQFPTVTIPTEKSPTVVIPKKAQPA